MDDDLAVDTDTLFVDAAADKVGINAGTDLSTYGALGVRTGADDRKGITVRRNSGSQTANLWEVQDEGGTALIQVNEDGDLESANFQSGIKGWQIAHDGDVEFANAWIRGELHCTVFVKDLIEAHAGTLGIFKSSGKLAADFSISPTHLVAASCSVPTTGFVSRASTPAACTTCGVLLPIRRIWAMAPSDTRTRINQAARA